ncbi:MAG: TraB/GumN family protein [Ferruginibacter sp.]
MTKILYLLSALFFANLVYGQDYPKTLLWRVTKKGNKNESYLFGTFHEVSPTFFNSLSNAVDKLHKSDVLFVEESISNTKQSTVQEESAWNFEKWKAIIAKEQEDIFHEYVEKIADTTIYARNPLSLLIGISRYYMTTFCESDTSLADLMDTHIQKLALKEDKQVHSLDINQDVMINSIHKTFSKQLDSNYAFNCIRGMKSTLDSNLSACELMNTYRTLNFNYELDTDIKQGADNTLLLTDRNNKWTTILDKAFLSGNCFVAVGIRHLCYKQGLVQQLRRIGYEVTPIPPRL